MRLGARIHDLKKQGHDITSEIVKGENRYGEATHFSKYTLRKRPGIEPKEGGTAVK